MRGKIFENTSVVVDMKRKRRDDVMGLECEETTMRNNGLDDVDIDIINLGPKNLQEA